MIGTKCAAASGQFSTIIQSGDATNKSGVGTASNAAPKGNSQISKTLSYIDAFTSIKARYEARRVRKRGASDCKGYLEMTKRCGRY